MPIDKDEHLTDRQALVTRAIDELGDSIFRLAYSHSDNKMDAEDIAQETFITLYQKLDATMISWDQEHLKAWLLRVTINKCKNHHKSSWNRTRATLDPDFDHSTQIDNDLSIGIKQAMGLLSDEQRLAIHLYYFEDYSTAMIAEVTEEQESTIRVRLHRARKVLKKTLGDYYDWS